MGTGTPFSLDLRIQTCRWCYSVSPSLPSDLISSLLSISIAFHHLPSSSIIFHHLPESSISFFTRLGTWKPVSPQGFSMQAAQATCLEHPSEAAPELSEDPREARLRCSAAPCPAISAGDVWWVGHPADYPPNLAWFRWGFNFGSLNLMKTCVFYDSFTSTNGIKWLGRGGIPDSFMFVIVLLGGGPRIVNIPRLNHQSQAIRSPKVVVITPKSIECPYDNWGGIPLFTPCSDTPMFGFMKARHLHISIFSIWSSLH